MVALPWHRLLGWLLPGLLLLGLAFAAVGQTPPANGASSPPPAATANAESAEPPAGQGLVDIIFAGGFIGVAIVLALVALSITAGYLVVDQAFFSLREDEIVPPGLVEEFQRCLASGQVAQAEQVARARPSFLAFVLRSGLAEVELGWSSVEKALEDATAEQAARLFRKIEYLSVIGNIAPMIGLLGTVFGMIFAFQQVAATQGAAGAADLAEGIYQALVTTVGGLLVAIPSLGAFAILRNRADGLVAEAAHSALEAFRPLKRARRREATPRTPTAAPPPPPKS